MAEEKVCNENSDITTSRLSIRRYPTIQYKSSSHDFDYGSSKNVCDSLNTDSSSLANMKTPLSIAGVNNSCCEGNGSLKNNKYGTNRNEINPRNYHMVKSGATVNSYEKFCGHQIVNVAQNLNRESLSDQKLQTTLNQKLNGPPDKPILNER